MKRIIIVLFVFSSILPAQDYDETIKWIFFGRQLSAKTEAMGRILTLGYDNNFLAQSNPASLISAEGVSLFYSKTSRLNRHFFNDLNCYYGGVSYKKENIGAFAFNIQYLNRGEFVKKTMNTDGSIENDDVVQLTEQLYTFTYSNIIYNWFSFGVNLNILKQTWVWENNPTGFFFEIGLLKTFYLLEATQTKDEITIGTQLKNILNQSITNEPIGSSDVVRYFPVIFRIGISNVVEYFAKNLYKHSHLIGLTTGFEYQNDLNLEYRTAYKFGGELSFLDILYWRFGYYYQTSHILFSNDFIEEFTYGFGVNLNFEHYLSNHFPISIKIDYVNLPQPSYVYYFYDRDNFNTLNLIINYRFH